MPYAPFDWIDAEARGRAAAGLVRTLRPRGAEPEPLDLASNDYLGLTRHPEVTAAAAGAAPLGGGGHRVPAGDRHHRPARRTRTRTRRLLRLRGRPRALLRIRGQPRRADRAVRARLLIVSDAGNHASIVDGCRLSRAETAVVPHADAEAVAKALGAHEGGPSPSPTRSSPWTATRPRSPRWPRSAAPRTPPCWSTTPTARRPRRRGRGALAAAGLAGNDGVVATLTLSKSLGSQGGAVLGPARVIDHLINTARTFIFDTGLAPASAGGALGALGVLRREPERAARAREVAAALYTRLTAAGLTAVRPDAAVVSVRAPSADAAVNWAADCRSAGMAVGCFRPPSVPDGVSRLRLTARADLTEEQITAAVDTIVATAPRQAGAPVS